MYKYIKKMSFLSQATELITNADIKESSKESYFKKLGILDKHLSKIKRPFF